ncbi:origin recognition complex subunit 4 C-terminus-domain-containing protein [Lasiosphaeris hirsuta]|uniref:Origin recognition complex subunit 4 n=1 Tax=Lasiosphaeris hirsuta TaxID=260670 RepID=A0AA40DU85_9PEZI|nr:origin recognition complex subunit 4 C-terminus-domain-containing protein [Lasiosphaeris hirsuta]
MASRKNTPKEPKGIKRPRAQNEDSPSVPAVVKRRRLKGADEKSGSTPSGTSSTGKRVVSTAGRPPLAKHSAIKGDDPWEIPDSADEATHDEPPPPKTQPQPKKQPRASTGSNKNAVYEVPDSGDELGGTAVTPRASRHRGTIGAANGANAESAAKANEPGRRARAPLTKQAANEAGDTAKKFNAVTKSRSVRKQKDVVDDGEADDEVMPDSPTSKRRPRKAAVDTLRAENAQNPKGILTPSRPNEDRRRKTVAFNSASAKKPAGETLEDALSKAAGSSSGSAKKPKQKALVKTKATADAEALDSELATAVEEEEDDEDEDDEVCAICSKPDSKRGNEIVFCDNCDLAYHQKCTDLPVVPEGDWICRNCSQEEVTLLAAGVGQEKVATVGARDETPSIPNFEQHLRSMQRVLLDRCTGRRRIKLCGQDETYEKASQLVEQTITAGEGNSMLVIGARGCGKTTLVESIVSDMAKEHNNQFHVVRLNGFIHTDDKLALREIWRQLGKEMEVEDELIDKTNNYADTMASLLALLSHPSEIAAAAQDGVTSRSVVFLIDEFDLFATHARQTLLYNLFDIAQARKAPIAVLGLTTRIDVVESLEKRVKSRFSHRYVYLSLPKNLPAFWDVCKQGLTIDDEDMEAEGIDLPLKGHDKFWKWWNGKIEALRQTGGFQDLLESYFCSTKSVSAFLTSCVLPLAALSPAAPSLQIPGPGMSLEPADSKLQVLEALSDLDLSMLIAAARLDIVAHTDTVNFAMAYDEYTSLMGRQRVQSASSGMLAMGGGARVWGRGIAGMAWERLVTLGMLIPAATVGRAGAGQSGLDAKMWKVDVALEEIPSVVKLNQVLGRWCREI